MNQKKLSFFKASCSRKSARYYDIDDIAHADWTTTGLSAFDVILPDPIPGKGSVLPAFQISGFEKIEAHMPNHLADIRRWKQVVPDLQSCANRGRAMSSTVKPLPVER